MNLPTLTDDDRAFIAQALRHSARYMDKANATRARDLADVIDAYPEPDAPALTEPR